MEGEQRVSSRQMKNDAEALSDALRNIPNTIDRLQVSMRNLSRCWEGPAWEAFQTQVNQDIQNMQEVYQHLIELQKGLGKGHDIYLRAEYDIYIDLKSIWI